MSLSPTVDKELSLICLQDGDEEKLLLLRLGDKDGEGGFIPFSFFF